MDSPDGAERWLRAGEALEILREAGVVIVPSTLWSWGERGHIGFRRTIGRHRRYRESEVRRVATGQEVTADA